jgi:hypothetical protein
MSGTVAHLGLRLQAYPLWTGLAGCSCGQDWWSIFGIMRTAAVA